MKPAKDMAAWEARRDSYLDRNQRLYEDRLAGMTYAKLSEKYGISMNNCRLHFEKSSHRAARTEATRRHWRNVTIGQKLALVIAWMQAAEAFEE